jgi:hypothetical protein
MYISIAICGYLSLLQNTPDIIISPVTPYQGEGGKDYFLLIGKFGMTLNLILALPVNLHPGRLQVLMLMNRDKNPSNALHVGISFAFLFGSAIIADVYPNIRTAFSFLGGTTGTLMSITFPGD